MRVKPSIGAAMAPFSQERSGTHARDVLIASLLVPLRAAVADGRLQQPALEWACHKPVGGQQQRSGAVFIDERSNEVVVVAETVCRQ